MTDGWRLQQTNSLRLACLVEVLSYKPGNVTPGNRFHDSRVEDYAVSARVIAPVLADTGRRGVGRSIHDAVSVTQAAVGHNTNLGIVLVLAPLAAVPCGISLANGIRDVLLRLSIEDADWTYRAIRVAAPGGLGSSAVQDVGRTPTKSLLECMRHAADRDLIARQYAENFSDVLKTGLRWLQQSSKAVAEPHRIGWVALQLLAAFGDSLIARKCGTDISETVRAMARSVLAMGWPHSTAGLRAWNDLDVFLRSDGNRLNPGTTADMIAAIVYAGLRDGAYRANPDLLADYENEEVR